MALSLEIEVLPMQAIAQKVGQQRVQPIPFTGLIERHYEMCERRECDQLSPSLDRASYRLHQPGTHRFERRGSLQGSSNRGGQIAENLFGQILRDLGGATGKAGDQRNSLWFCRKPESRKLHGYGPALSAGRQEFPLRQREIGHQCFDFACTKTKCVRLKLE